MFQKKDGIILKFDFLAEQTVGSISKKVGFVKAKFLVSVIDDLTLEANPRSAKTGSVTDAIQESIENVPELFPFKTKGILLAASQYEMLERGRIKIIPQNPQIEGILDGGHNTLAVGMYILKNVFEFRGASLSHKAKTWSEFKELWEENRDEIDEYLEDLRNHPDDRTLDFYMPVELLVPRDPQNQACVDEFKNDLLEICSARNNNVQLPVSAKANQRGYFDTLRELMELQNSEINTRIEWKTNDGGDIKVENLIALAWIPLALIKPVHDENKKTIEAVAPNALYSRKGSCLGQFEKLMSSPEVTNETSADYRRELCNPEVLSAFEIAVKLPELYDYIFEEFPRLYNAAGGNYGRITAVKVLNEKRKEKCTPFTQKKIETLSPEGYIMPLVYGLQALMQHQSDANGDRIVWNEDPVEFLQIHLSKVVKYYAGIFSMCEYDPQKIGKNAQSYEQAKAGFKMVKAGIL